MHKTFLLIAISLLFVSGAMADGVCPTGGGSLSAYIPVAYGGTSVFTSCHIGTLDFSNFFFGSTSGGGANPLSPSQIAVNTVNNGPLGEGFAFAPISGLTVTQPGNIDVEVGFTVTGASLDDLGISFNATTGGSGNADFTESWCFANETVPSCIVATDGSFHVHDPPPNLKNTKVFASPVPALTVLKDVAINTGSTTGNANVSAFGNTFSYVPEPTYTALLAVGLLGLGWMRKRRQSEQR
jgi:hypothetical protein